MNNNPPKTTYIDIIWIVSLSLYAFILRVVRVNQPLEIYFDETYYVKAAKNYFTLQPDTNWVHPPLGKILIAVGIKFLGDNPLGWRIAGVFLSSLMVVFIYLLAKRLFKSRMAAISAGILLCFNSLSFVQSRIATLDTSLALMILIAFYFFYLYLDENSHPKKYLFLTFIFLGLATACKWSGIFAGAGCLVIWLAYKNPKYNTNPPKENFLFVICAGILITMGVYLLTYLPFFLEKQTLSQFWYNHTRTLHFHYLEPFRHTYLSKFWTWPFMIRPMWYYYKELSPNIVNGIIAMDNPFFWWSFLFFFAFLIYKLVKTKDLKLFFILISYLSLYLLWGISLKGGFFYYMLSCVPFMILTVVYGLNIWWCNKNLWMLTFVYFGFYVGFFALFYPVLANFPISKIFFYKLMWFRSWI